MADADPCANCGAPLGGARFCGACGQRRALPLEAWRIARDSAGQMVDLEGPWLRTLRELTLRPGAMVRRYVAGERQRFVNPILYAVTAATVLLLAMHALGVDIGTLQGVEASRHEDFNLVLRSLGYLAVIGALPVAALMRPVLRGRTVGELYVLLLYAYGQLMLWQVGLYALGAGSDLYAFWASADSERALLRLGVRRVLRLAADAGRARRARGLRRDAGHVVGVRCGVDRGEDPGRAGHRFVLEMEQTGR